MAKVQKLRLVEEDRRRELVRGLLKKHWKWVALIAFILISFLASIFILYFNAYQGLTQTEWNPLLLILTVAAIASSVYSSVYKNSYAKKLKKYSSYLRFGVLIWAVIFYGFNGIYLAALMIVSIFLGTQILKRVKV